jgi:hypothetical protein
MKDLYSKEDFSESLIDRIGHHAKALGQRICSSFAALRDIIERHETLIRKRWIKRSPSQRREVLLAAWPIMPRDYQPDNVWSPMPHSKCNLITFNSFNIANNT